MPVVNENSRFKVGTLWKVIIKYVLPVFLIGMWLVGIYDLFTDVNSFEVTLYIVITVLVLVFSGILTKIKSD
jgi:NSS family neurotransmitter:Na+ symporter